MAGPFRGAVGKLKKIKSKSKKGRTSNALVKRSRKLKPEDVAARVDALVGIGSSEADAPAPSGASSVASGSSSFLAKVHQRVGSKVATGAAGGTASGSVKVKPMEVVAADGKTRERVMETEAAAPERSSKEALGLKLLHRAVKTQSHNRTLPHQQRPDYEFRLRRIATVGVTRLFNSLAQSQTAGAEIMEASNMKVTLDKAQEKKLLASRDAFLAALRAPGAQTSNDFY